jgi:hypothetical protein
VAGDYGDFVFRLPEGSDIIHVYPNALVQIYQSGTDTLVTEVSADANGNWQIPVLALGKYDVKVDGKLSRTIHHVPYDHTHSPDQSWQLFKSGSITGDQDESNTMQVFGTDVAGDIVQIKILAEHVDATGNLTVHLLKGIVNGATTMTVATNSVWSHQINPGSEKYRYQHIDNTPGITLAIGDAVTIGIDHTANTVEGLTILLMFRPEAA